MKAIEVRVPGLLTTVQDLGREGFGPLGVSPSGAADAVAMRIGNRLVGNPEGAAALEMTLLGGAFVFPDGGVIALAGSDFGATLDDVGLETWTSVSIRPGQTLKCGATRSGARCYLCVQGGIEVKRLLGSASTHLLSGLGGLQGRALRKGDVLHIARAREAFRTFRKKRVSGRALAKLAPSRILRVTPGPQADWFPAAVLKAFYESPYRVTEESNRMGLRLDGPPVPTDSLGEMISEGVALGAVQIPSGGKPIILFIEQQTTGGYPKIANVISADFHSLAQLRPRDEIRFEQVEMDMARKLLREQEEWLASKELIVE
ncbi:MAG TPA: biotin-dependent carboxyltransferase family protein [Candidatus Methylomirabilis sp.]|nr:biotin-dependent carboxyltransferase family protein [Candidatus Methylomirabilis sp.]